MRGILLHAATERRRRSGLFDPLLTDTYVLADHIATIATRARVLSLEEILDHLAENRPFPANAVHLSIDHGYQSTLVAAELLDRHRLPWTLFVTVDAVVDRRPPWSVRLADAVAVSSNVLDADGMLHDLSDHEGKRRFFALATAAVRGAGPRAEEVARGILDLPGMSEPDESHWAFLTVQDVAELQAAGVAIGSHSLSGVGLGGATTEQLEAEVSASGQRLAAVLGSPVRFFAYPDGHHDRRALRLVARHYELAVAGPHAPLAQTRYRLARHDAGHDPAGVAAALGDTTDAPGSRSCRLRGLALRVAARHLVPTPGTPYGPGTPHRPGAPSVPGTPTRRSR